MNVFAYCARTFERSTRRASGVQPVTSPPVDADSFDVRWLADRQLLYFDLHGQPGEPFWCGEWRDALGVQRTLALTADQLRAADLDGAVVFALTCYLGDEDSPMLDALLDAGAYLVIGGDGRNYGGENRLFGAAHLGKWFRYYLAINLDPLRALKFAKARLAITLARDKLLNRRESVEAARDTLAFRAYGRI